MTKTAYLVGVLDTNKYPPTFLGAGVFSEPCPTLGGHKFPFTIAECTANTYEESKEGLRGMTSHPGAEWMARLIDSDVRGGL